MQVDEKFYTIMHQSKTQIKMYIVYIHFFLLILVNVIKVHIVVSESISFLRFALKSRHFNICLDCFEVG